MSEEAQKTEAQKVDNEQLEEARKELVKVMREHPLIAQVFGVLLSTRRLYGLARLELTKLLTELMPDDPDHRSLFTDVLVQAADYQSRQPFTDDENVQAVQGVLLPFAMNLRSQANLEAAQERAEIAAEAEKARRASAVRTGIADDTIQRGQCLIVSGNPEDVYRLLDVTMQQALDPEKPLRVLRLGAETAWPERSRREYSVWDEVCYIPLANWQFCAENWRKLMRVLLRFDQARLESRMWPDLIICDRLQSGHEWRVTHQAAAKTLKVLRKLAEDFGAALICGYPLGAKEDKKDLGHLTAWASVRTFGTEPKDPEDPESPRLAVFAETVKVELPRERILPEVKLVGIAEPGSIEIASEQETKILTP